MVDARGQASSSTSRQQQQRPPPAIDPTLVDRRRDAVELRGVAPSASSRRSSSSWLTNDKSRLGATKVRTVPPSAAFDPPSPTESVEQLDASPLPHAPNSARPTTGRRPRPKLRYSTSSGSDLEDDTDSEDDEPPWWTFTSRGMAKMRARTMRPKGSAPLERGRSDPGGTSDGPSGARSAPVLGPPFVPGRSADATGGNGSGDVTDSAVESAPSRSRHRRDGWRSGARKSSRDSPSRDDSPLPPPPPRLGRQSSDSPSRLHAPRLLGAHATNLLFHRRRSPNGTETPPQLPIASRTHKLQRSSSAPGSPVPHDRVPAPFAAMTAPDAVAAAGPSEVLTDGEAGRPRAPPMKRQSTTPSLSFLKRRSTASENLTDSEAHMHTSPRMRAAQAKHIPPISPLLADNAQLPQEEGGRGRPSDQPGTPHLQQRRGTRLRLALPPAIPHLNWQLHPGSWQDALYGTYNEASPERGHETPRGGAGSRPRQTSEPTRPRPHRGSTSSRRLSTTGRSNEQQATPKTRSKRSGSNHQHSQQAEEHEMAPIPGIRREKTRRRRHRQAQVPPTPRGLGFTPADERDDPIESAGAGGPARSGGNGFAWGSGAMNGNGHADAIAEMDELGRSETRATITLAATEKSDSFKKRAGRTWYGRRKGPGKVRKVNIEDRKERWKRYLFLDARHTIIIRLINLVAVTILLALSVTIRLELHQLMLPGVIGPSTTLTIAYAAFTILHLLTAIYREYFGRPIGLWGLRSKMLWVCLDLIFIALWSSAMSLAINDYIATPLDCTAATPWWTNGLEGNYERLLEILADTSAAAIAPLLSNSSDASGTTGSWTPADRVAQTLGITLPDQVIHSGIAREACRRQVGSVALSLLTLLLYGGNMVLSLFRIFETVRRTADVGRAVMV